MTDVILTNLEIFSAGKHELQLLNDLLETLPLLQTFEFVFETEALKLNFQASDRVLHFSCSSPQLTMKAIFQQLSQKENFDSQFVFVEYQRLHNSKIFNLLARAFEEFPATIFIIDCSESTQEDVMVLERKFHSCELDERIIYVSNETLIMRIFDVEYITHAWSDFTPKFQHELLNHKLIFQGQEVCLKDVIDIDTTQAIPVNKLLRKQKFKIGKETR